MLNIEIDGVKIKTKENLMIMEVADNNSIFIPRFCYHKKLSIVANCRICFVEIEDQQNLVPACATPVVDGMKIFTKSKKVLEYRKSVMEFLLINHPFDCYNCDQGGECELQDIAFIYGKNKSRYKEKKRINCENKINMNPLINFYPRRCILCTRCVRFLKDITNSFELGVIGKSIDSHIATCFKDDIASPLSGNVIDLCPTGALTNKLFADKFRSWELKIKPAISIHDCVGSNIYFHEKNNKLLRIAPRKNDKINEIWISDRDRFCVDGINSENRLKNTWFKKNNSWQAITLAEGIKIAASKLNKIILEKKPEMIASITSPSMSLEEQYLLKKVMKKIGSNNVTHKIKQINFEDQNLVPIFPNLGLKLDELERQKQILLIGSNVDEEQPIIGLKLRKMVKENGEIYAINPMDFKFSFNVKIKSTIQQEEMVFYLLGILKALILEKNNNDNNLARNNNSSNYNNNDNNDKNSYFVDDEKKISNKIVLDKEILNLEKTALKDLKPSNEQKIIAKKLLQNSECLVLVGTLLVSSNLYSNILFCSQLIAKISNSKFGMLTYGANDLGACLSKYILDENLNNVDNDLAINNIAAKTKITELNINQILSKKIDACLLFDIDPDLDCIKGNSAKENLKNCDFVVSFSAYDLENLKEISDLIFPISTFAEQNATYINAAGDLQRTQGIIDKKCKFSSISIWQILKLLADELDFNDFDYTSTNDIFEEIYEKVKICFDLKRNHFDLLDGFCKINSENFSNNLNEIKMSNYFSNYLNKYFGKKKELDFNNKEVNFSNNSNKDNNIFSILPIYPLYWTDLIVRHSEILQKTNYMLDKKFIKINSHMARNLNLRDHDVVKIVAANVNLGSTQKVNLKNAKDSKDSKESEDSKDSKESEDSKDLNKFIDVKVDFVLKIDDALLDGIVVVYLGNKKTASLSDFICNDYKVFIKKI